MLLTLATYAFAQELRDDHPTTYVVQKGDTLWDISARFLKKPWLWPEIWQANPQVKNPHLIYPGDVLSLVYIDGNRVTASGPRAGEAITAIPLAELEPFLKQLTIIADAQSLPYVVGLEDDRLLTSSGQLVYVAGMSGATPGQMVDIARPINRYYEGRETFYPSTLNFRGDEFHHDWATFWADTRATPSNGHSIGDELMLHSIGEVTQVAANGVVSVLLREENRDVRVGDRVLPMEEHPYDPYFYPSAMASYPEARRVASVTDDLYTAGKYQVIALAVGARDGVKNGTTFGLWHEGEVRQDRVGHKNLIEAKRNSLKMPDEFVGHAMVFRTFDRVSYALIMDGIKPAQVGDLLKHPDATR